MKIMRNIISFLVGSTFALCLASCSGGMHDASTDPYRAGNVNASGEGSVFLVGGLAQAYVDESQYKSKSTTALAGQTVFEVALSSEGKIDFTFSYQGSDSWGGGAGEINFAILSDVDNGWSPNMRWGGVSGSPVKVGGSADIEAGSTNITLSGMTSGHQYKLSGVLYAAGGLLSLEDKGEFTIPVPDYTLLDGYFIRGVVPYYEGDTLKRKWDVGDCGNFVLVNGAKSDEGDVVYEVKWVATIGNLPVEFLISDSQAKTNYKVFAKNDQSLPLPKVDIDGAELEVVIADDKDKENTYGNIESKQTLFENVEYTFRIRTTASKKEKDKDGNEIEIGKKVFVSIISGNDFSLNLSEADIAFGSELELVNNAVAFVWYKGIGKWEGNDNFAFKVRPNKAWDDDVVGGDSIIIGNTPNDNIQFSVMGNDRNAVLSGLTEGTAYKLSFTPEGRNLMLTVEEIEKVEKLSKDEQDKLTTGKWYFVDIEISSTTVNMIIKDNVANGLQSRDIEKVAVKDKLSYVYMVGEPLLSDKGYYILSPLQFVSERTDTPSASGAAGKTRIYVYTNAEEPYLYAWNENGEFAGGWPGKAMTLFKE